eukprot:GHVN01031189.1.p1 GENE.GHVN01031189.1~~GHVN01031189.1.p1  ORF type:complete len:120 (-),score=6.49 GHVN01031189.1:529-888(-)
MMNCSKERHLPLLYKKNALSGKVSELYLDDHACRMISFFDLLDGAKVWISCSEEKHLPSFEDGIAIGGNISELSLNDHACRLLTQFDLVNGARVLVNGVLRLDLGRPVYSRGGLARLFH